ncbi:hypothetical protein ACPTGM_33290, partial [Pseudomonas aeruginosa]|uniref:hypothetical protein n=1 Tax=Pseudomonas aeruginosa TaxID=287 RepID=UPI003CC6C3D1
KQLNTWVSFQSAEQPLLGQFSVSGNRHDSCALTSSPFGFKSGSEFGLTGLTDLHHALGFWNLAALCWGEVLGPGPFLPLLFCCSFRVICCKSAIYLSLAANSLLLGCDFVGRKLARRW